MKKDLFIWISVGVRKKRCWVFRICFLIATFFLFFPLSALTQSAVLYIPPSGSVFVHGKDTLALFGPVINEGDFRSQQNAVIDFLGEKWTNHPAAFMSGEREQADGLGGTFRFIGDKKQRIVGGFNFGAKTGPSFPNLSLENGKGLYLEELNDLHVRGKLHLKKGHLFLRGWKVLVGDSITSYSDTSYIITGKSTGTAAVYRSTVSGEELVFPIGTGRHSYSPIALKEAQASRKEIGVDVFDHVYEHAQSGKILDRHFVKKTWQIRDGTAGGETYIRAQYEKNEEGGSFSAYADSSYISLYDEYQKEWDSDPLAHQVFPYGTLTTQTPLPDSRVNDRIFPNGLPNTEKAVTWLSVSSAHFSEIGCPVADFSTWEVQRYSPEFVQLFWRTHTEQNVLYYEVQRQEGKDTAFRTVRTVPAGRPANPNDGIRYYFLADSNSHDGESYYRLKMTNGDGCIVFTDKKQILPGIDVDVHPNPSSGRIRIKIKGPSVPVQLQITNAGGHVLSQYTVQDGEMIDLSHLPDATYYLFFFNGKKNREKIKSTKLVLQRRR